MLVFLRAKLRSLWGGGGDILAFSPWVPEDLVLAKAIDTHMFWTVINTMDSYSLLHYTCPYEINLEGR